MSVELILNEREALTVLHALAYRAERLHEAGLNSTSLHHNACSLAVTVDDAIREARIAGSAVLSADT